MHNFVGVLSLISVIGFIVSVVVTWVEIFANSRLSPTRFLSGHIVCHGILLVELSDAFKKPGKVIASKVRYLVLPSGLVFVCGRFEFSRQSLARTILQPDGNQVIYTVRIPYAFYAIYVFMILYVITLGLKYLAQGGSDPFTTVLSFFIPIGFFALFASGIVILEIRRVKRTLNQLIYGASVA